MTSEDEYQERSPADDRPPIDVARFHPSTRAKLLGADNSLGWLEVAVMHARNEFREIVASEDVDANTKRIAEIVTLLGPIERIAESLHATFADFDTHLRSRVRRRPGHDDESASP